MIIAVTMKKNNYVSINHVTYLNTVATVSNSKCGVTQENLVT